MDSEVNIKINALADLRERIDIPFTSYVQRTENYLRFIYYLDGNKKQITLGSREEAAAFLKHRRWIKDYHLDGNGRVHFCTEASYLCQQNDKPVLLGCKTELEWEQFDQAFFERHILKHTLAEYEWDKNVAPVMHRYQQAPTLIKTHYIPYDQIPCA